MNLTRCSAVTRALIAGIAILASFLGPALCLAEENAPLSPIHAQGTQFVDAAGNAVILKGCNLGNWLLIELWMLGGCIKARDQATLFNTLNQRFGPDRGYQLMQTYRGNWITPRDFQMIRSFGFNVVRLPIDYRLLQSDQAPYALKEEGFKWVDKAVDMAQAAHVYVILDMHSVPGGQSDDQDTGEVHTNHFWNNPVNHQRTADLWRAMAQRYRNRSNVAGYDLMNEPFADHKTDVREDLKKIMLECYTAVRDTGDQHIVFFPGTLDKSPAFYDDPHSHNWTNVAFTEHFYPGLFGGKVAFESHLTALTKTFPARQRWLDRAQLPYFVGEFNPVQDATGGAEVTRAYFDTFAQHGWAATMWSYKLVKPTGGASSNTWYCATNAANLPKLSLTGSSYEDFEQFFSTLGTAPLAANPPLLTAMTQSQSPLLPLLTSHRVSTIIAETGTPPAGWNVADIGASTGGSVVAHEDGSVSIVAGGDDIFGRRDGFKFVSRRLDNSNSLCVRVQSLAESDQYAKTGVMARWGDDPTAAFAMINTFPDGSIAFISRDQAGAEAKETKPVTGGLPVDLQLICNGDQVTARYRRAAGEWTQLGAVVIADSHSPSIGVAVDSHNPDAMTKAVVGVIDPQSAPAVAVDDDASTLLKDGSFVDGDEWNQTGSALQRPAGGGVRYESADGKRRCELSQNVAVEPGKRYRFTVRAWGDRQLAGSAKVELRLEGTLDGTPVTLNMATFNARDLGSGGRRSPMSIDGTALGDKLTAKITISSTGSGELLLNDARLQPIVP
jgi:endoglucanase